MGKAQLALRDFAAANQSYAAAASLDPKLAEAWYGVGITYRSLADQKLNHAARAEQQRTEEARKLLDQAVAALHLAKPFHRDVPVGTQEVDDGEKVREECSKQQVGWAGWYT